MIEQANIITVAGTLLILVGIGIIVWQAIELRNAKQPVKELEAKELAIRALMADIQKLNDKLNGHESLYAELISDTFWKSIERGELPIEQGLYIIADDENHIRLLKGAKDCFYVQDGHPSESVTNVVYWLGPFVMPFDIMNKVKWLKHEKAILGYRPGESE